MAFMWEAQNKSNNSIIIAKLMYEGVSISFVAWHIITSQGVI